jgi:hypothetical protein
MRDKILAGTTSYMAPIYIQLLSTGAGIGSLVYNSASLVGEYRRAGSATWTSISLITATLGTFASGGFIADGGLAGAYEVGIPNAALASGVPWVVVRYYGYSGMSPVLLYIELDAVNYQDGVRLGLTGLANAVPGAAGGLFIAGTNAATVVTTSLTTTFTGNLTGSVGSVTGAVGSVTGNVGGNVVGSTASVTGAVGSVTGNVGGNVSGSVTGSVASVTGNVGGNVTGSVASVTAPVSVLLTQTLNTGRALDLIADTSLTLNDALICAVSIATGKQTIVGTAYTIETPFTATVLRTFLLNSATTPTARA